MAGYCNTGYCNTGGWNTGSENTGCFNTEWWNAGDCNHGNHNTGHCNIGNWNTGYYNTGDWNTRSWNKANHSSGCFNTEEAKIYLFNKPSEWTYSDWPNSDARYILSKVPYKSAEYAPLDNMTDEEKEKFHYTEVMGGYLKKVDNSQTVNKCCVTCPMTKKRASCLFRILTRPYSKKLRELTLIYSANPKASQGRIL